MVRTISTMLPLGTAAPEFELHDTDGSLVSRDQVARRRGLLVIFLCNHCPYVKHVAAELKKVADECLSQGIGVVGISSNDAAAYPDDGPEAMKQEKALRGYAFPYLYDESQSVAKAYHAACTPDFFLFDQELKLVYRGQMDDSRPKTDRPVTGIDLRAAITALLAARHRLRNRRQAWVATSSGVKGMNRFTLIPRVRGLEVKFLDVLLAAKRRQHIAPDLLERAPRVPAQSEVTGKHGRSDERHALHSKMVAESQSRHGMHQHGLMIGVHIAC